MKTATVQAAEAVKVGTILVNVWGYSMTIVDYYRVVKVSAKSVVIAPISSEETGTGYLSGTSVPRTDGAVASVDLLKDGQPQMFRAFIRESYDKDICFVSKLGHYGVMNYLRIWDGRPRHFNHCD